MAKQSEPQLREFTIEVSHGGQVQIIKYDVQSEYEVRVARTFSIPEGLSTEEAVDFEAQAFDELRATVDERANIEFEERWDQSYLKKKYDRS